MRVLKPEALWRRLTLVYALPLTFLVACTTASTASSPEDSGADPTRGGSVTPPDCSSIPQQRPYDSAQGCFEDAIDLVGICRQRAAGVPTTGVEFVCASNGKQLFVLVVGTDQILTGSGWTFGSRAAPDVVHQQSTLSAADDRACTAAKAISPDRTCSSDAGAADALDDDR